MANGAGNDHPHLELAREEPVTERRPRPGFSATEPPDDVRRHAAALGKRLRAARDAAADDLGGYDERRLIKITLTDKLSPKDIERASGNVEIVSQEGDRLILAFGSDAQLEVFEARARQPRSG